MLKDKVKTNSSSSGNLSNEERFELIKRNVSEIVTEPELKELITLKKQP